MGSGKHTPRLIAWEITRSCVLNCVHCRAAAKYGPYSNEFSTKECYNFLDDVAANFEFKPIIILTGGEPMMREDIYDVAAYGTKLGLRMVMAPCGLLVDREKAQKMKDAGIQRISLSLDGATAETHDRFRQVEGSFAGVMKAMEHAKAVGLPFQVNTTIAKVNVHEVPDILKMVVELGAAAYHPFLLVPTGRGKDMADQEISPKEYERILNWVYDQRTVVPKGFVFKPTCAPHYYRIYRQREAEEGRDVTFETHGLNAMSKGCMGGTGFAFVSHVGKVQICGFLEEECGDVRDEAFSKIWENSKVFAEMRAIDEYHGKCGYCDYRKWCGGCRARAFAVTNDYLASEPYCTYKPKK